MTGATSMLDSKSPLYRAFTRSKRGGDVTRGMQALYAGCATDPRNPEQATATRIAQIVPLLAKTTMAAVRTHCARAAQPATRLGP